MEFRIKDVDIEYNDTKEMKIGGYINITNRESEVLFSRKRNKWFKEIIKVGTFKRSLEVNSSIPLLLEHDFSKEIAHTDKGNFTLREDKLGLRFDATIEDKDLYQKIATREITSCSFGFRVLEEEFEPINPKLERRYISKIELIECSLVHMPAYEGSLVETRMMLEELKKSELEVEETVEVIETEVEEKNEKNTNTKEENGQPNLDTTITETIENDNIEEIVEEEIKEEIVEVNEVVSTEEEVQEVETKSLDESIVTEMPVNTVEVEETTIEMANDIIKDIIEEKEEELSNLETEEVLLNQHIETVKEETKREENFLKSESMRLSSEVIRLRLELLKLKTIKERLV